LTASNQHYFLFPYTVYDASGALNAHIGFGAIDIQYKHKLFQYHIMLGAAYVFEGPVSVHIHYKEKKLFGGREAAEDINLLDAGGLGAAFLLLDAGIHNTSSTISFGIKKLFVLPWGYEGLLNSGDNPSPDIGSGGESGVNISMLRTILLSGLSCYIRVSPAARSRH
jgi:hypothetical protein